MQTEPEQDMWDCLGLLFDGLPREGLAGHKEDAQ